ncbi:MAG: hypothetical protein IKS47_03860 [Bacteroidales bacterium]|nr:hypothetical protein [Bacteroidales bacterium]
MKRFRLLLALTVTLLATAGCGIYSFSGTSIQSDVHSICIEPVVNKAIKVNPSLANQITEALNDKFRKLTKLEQVSEDGDLDLLVTIESYDVRASAVTADEVAAMNRLTVTCKVVFTNVKHPDDNIEGQSFAAYEDYDSNNSLDMVEARLCDAIVEKLVEDIFNATVAQW